MALMDSDDCPKEDILAAVNDLNDDEFAKFEKEEQIEYLNNHPWLISYHAIKKCQDKIQMYIDRLYGHWAFLEYYEDEHKYDMSDALKHRKEQYVKKFQYQIKSLEAFDTALATFPLIPNKTLLEYERGDYVMYGTYFDHILCIERKDHTPISKDDSIPFKFIKVGVEVALASNPACSHITNYSYEVIPDFAENKWFVHIKPNSKVVEEKKKRKLFAKKEETRKR